MRYIDGTCRYSRNIKGRSLLTAIILLQLFLFFIIYSSGIAIAGNNDPATVGNNGILFAAMHGEEHIDQTDASVDEYGTEDDMFEVYDPVEPFNRLMFKFNDRLYFWVLRPVAREYSRIVPKQGRVAVRRFFLNLTTPIRFVNAMLQFKFKVAGIELSRFFINTTIGVAGLMDPARDRWRLFVNLEDFGQTLGFYHAGPGFYITWPVIGPSTLRDTLGLVGDTVLDPTTYLFPNDRWGVYALYGYRFVNETSLETGTYESIKKASLDPYAFVRDAYIQHRRSMIKK